MQLGRTSKRIFLFFFSCSIQKMCIEHKLTSHCSSFHFSEYCCLPPHILKLPFILEALSRKARVLEHGLHGRFFVHFEFISSSFWHNNHDVLKLSVMPFLDKIPPHKDCPTSPRYTYYYLRHGCLVLIFLDVWIFIQPKLSCIGGRICASGLESESVYFNRLQLRLWLRTKWLTPTDPHSGFDSGSTALWPLLNFF